MIKINNLSYRFDPRKTDGISNINLEAKAGEILSLLGPSGSGKTTTLKCIAGIITEFQGSIDIEKEQVILYMDQNSQLPKNQTVFDFLLQQLKSEADELSKENQIRMTLASLELTNEILSPIDNLSAGQRQRVILAKNLIQNPTILLLDEPFTNLDKSLRLQLFQDMLPLLKERKITLIWVTHNQEEALRFSQKIVLLNFGAVQQIGTPRELYFEPKNLFTARFFGETNTIVTQLLESPNNQFKFKIFDKDFLLPQNPNRLREQRTELVACIRPEFIKLVAEGEQTDFEAVVTQKYFLGENVLVKCRLPETFLWLKMSSLEKVELNQKIQISLDIQNIHFLREV